MRRCKVILQAIEDGKHSKLLKLLNMYLHGPIKELNRRGKTYVLTIINNYFRFTWILFHNTKNEICFYHFCETSIKEIKN